MESVITFFGNNDVVYDIPDSFSYMEVVRILGNSGYNIYKETDENFYHIFPNICMAEGIICGCTNTYMRLHAKNKYSYHEFMQMARPDDEEWRDKLSKKFNEKICKENTTTCGTG